MAATATPATPSADAPAPRVRVRATPVVEPAPSRFTTIVGSRKTHGIVLTLIALALLAILLYLIWPASWSSRSAYTNTPLIDLTIPVVPPKAAGLAPSATVGTNCSQKDCVIVAFQSYTVKGSDGTVGNFGSCVSVPNTGDAKVVRCKDQNGWTARFVHDPQGRLREVKHDS